MTRHLTAALATCWAIGALWAVGHAAAFLHALTTDLGRHLLGLTSEREDQ